MHQIDGYKTYIISAAAVLAGVAGYITGEVTMAEAVTMGLGGLGLGTLRHGVAKSGPKVKK